MLNANADLSSWSHSQVCVVCSSCSAGNPGVVGFYRTFMQTIHRLCGYQHPVWAVSHAGHCTPPDSMDLLEGRASSEQPVSYINLMLRSHRLLFIEDVYIQCVPDTVQLIGCSDTSSSLFWYCCFYFFLRVFSISTLTKCCIDRGRTASACPCVRSSAAG